MEDKKNLYQHVDEKFIVDYYKFIPTREQLEDLPEKKPNKVFHTYINNNLTIIIVEKIRLNTKRRNYPTFKSKFSRQAYRTNCIRSNYKGKDYSNIIIFKECNKIKLPKLGLVKIRGYRSLEKIDGNIINATITKEL